MFMLAAFFAGRKTALDGWYEGGLLVGGLFLLGVVIGLIWFGIEEAERYTKRRKARRA
jgi:hypothetical protein